MEWESISFSNISYLHVFFFGKYFFIIEVLKISDLSLKISERIKRNSKG